MNQERKLQDQIEKHRKQIAEFNHRIHILEEAKRRLLRAGNRAGAKNKLKEQRLIERKRAAIERIAEVSEQMLHHSEQAQSIRETAEVLQEFGTMSVPPSLTKNLEKIIDTVGDNQAAIGDIHQLFEQSASGFYTEDDDELERELNDLANEAEGREANEQHLPVSTQTKTGTPDPIVMPSPEVQYMTGAPQRTRQALFA